jgi:two-component system C4-dicarboxylate transport response regulator DctD
MVEVFVSERSAQVLLVDGDAGLRRAARWCLGRAGYGVVEFGSASEALEILVSGRSFDVVVADGDLPGTRAKLFAACTKLDPYLPIVTMSDGPRPRARRRRAKGGVVLCLEKPVDLDLLVQSVSEVIASARQR